MNIGKRNYILILKKLLKKLKIHPELLQLYQS